MSLEAKSQELKDLVSTFDTQWFLGDLAFLTTCITNGAAQEELGELSSPLRQLYFLGGLMLSTDIKGSGEVQFNPETWKKIVVLLNEIESEYYQLFFPKPDEEVDEKWKIIRGVAMPSFLSYFNQGLLNYEEQTINWIRDLYGPMNKEIETELGVGVEDFIAFYEAVDALHQTKFMAFSTNPELMDPDWLNYTELKVGVDDNAPDFIKQMGMPDMSMYTFMADKGIKDRFKAEDLVSEQLPLDKIKVILSVLSCQRKQNDFLYYTSTKPGNPLYEHPIVDIGNDLFQIFEIKQIIHAIEGIFENVCSKEAKSRDKFIKGKGKLLEHRVLGLFKEFFKKDYTYFESYYVDGNEHDILFLWKNYAFIIEAKGYNLREPMRDPEKAFVKIKNDFDDCIGYGYKQTKRIQQKFVDQVPLRIEDHKGNLIKEIDTSKYKGNDFSIVVNLNSFGQIQNDLSTLLDIDEDDVYPWVVKLDDLEVFFLTMLAKNKRPEDFVEFLLLREELHGKLVCSDELEVCGGFLEGELTESKIEGMGKIITTPDLPEIFDDQYRKGMGLVNEKYLKEKKSGKFHFW
ncbi:NERD domain-containing protein [Flagellimonas sp.]|uniref:NERD domain-containing protein n=1 Tax=Flagellimonas sp. TaxID=2058762 RepID=UPI003AB8F893